MQYQQKAFTLVEIIISITITSIFILGIVYFISNIFREISFSHKQVSFLSEINTFSTTISEQKNFYGSGYVLINKTINGSDIVVFQDTNSQQGVVFGVVDTQSMRLENTSDRYNTYYDKVIGYRRLNQNELSQIASNPNTVYTFDFFKDTIFPMIKIYDFQVDMYNEKIFHVSMKVNLDYDPGLDGKQFSDVNRENIAQFYLNF